MEIDGFKFTNLDVIAMIIFSACWVLYSVMTDLKRKSGTQGVLGVMNVHRLNWMKVMLRRENRMSDVSAVGNLMRSISFFASTTVLIIVGLVSVIGNSDLAFKIMESVPFAAHTDFIVWEFKLLLLCIIFVYAFFKYTWSLRQYNYVNIMIAGAPLHNQNLDIHDQYARKAATLAGNAAAHFASGLRAYYFAMAVMAWFIHPAAFIAISLLVMAVLYRREFYSRTLNSIMMDEFQIPTPKTAKEQL